MENKRILIVEDDPLVADVLGEIIETFGLDVIRVDTGMDAVEAVSQHNIDLVIMDLELPYMPGTEAAAKVLAEKPDMKIIFSTGFSEHEDKIDTSNPNIVTVIRKPFDIADIKAVIEKAFINH